MNSNKPRSVLHGAVLVSNTQDSSYLHYLLSRNTIKGKKIQFAKQHEHEGVGVS